MRHATRFVLAIALLATVLVCGRASGSSAQTVLALANAAPQAQPFEQRGLLNHIVLLPFLGVVWRRPLTSFGQQTGT